MSNVTVVTHKDQQKQQENKKAQEELKEVKKAKVEAESEEEEEEEEKEERVKQPICDTEFELRAHVQPEKMKGYRVVVGDKVKFTYSNNSDNAVVRVAKSLGAKANTLGKVPTQEEIYSDFMGLSPEAQQALIEKITKLKK